MRIDDLNHTFVTAYCIDPRTITLELQFILSPNLVYIVSTSPHLLQYKSENSEC